MDTFDRPAALSVQVQRVRLPGPIDGPVIVDGEPFSGIGLVPTSDEFCFEPVRVLDGMAQDVFDDPFLPKGTLVELSGQADYESHRTDDRSLNGEPFTGVTVRFGHGPSANRVVGAEVVEQGRVTETYFLSSAGHVQNMSVRVVFDEEDEPELQSVSQSFHWFASGTVSRTSAGFGFRDGTSASAGVGNSASNELTRLHVSAGYFDAVEHLGDRLVLPFRLRNLDALDQFGPTDGELSLDLGDRPVELATKLVSTGLLDLVEVLQVENLLSDGLPGLEILFAAELPELWGVIVDNSRGIDFSELLTPLLGVFRRHPRIAVGLEGWAIKQIGLLKDRPSSDDFGHALYFDEQIEQVVGFQFRQNLRGSIAKIVAESPSLRFVRFSQEDGEQHVDELLKGRPDVVVYGPEVTSAEWPALVWKQLEDEGII